MSDQSTPPSWRDKPTGDGSTPPPPPPPPPSPYSGQQDAPYSAQYSGQYAGQGGLAYAGWGKRVLATLVDGLVGIPAAIVMFVGFLVAFSGVTTTTDPVTNQQTLQGLNGAGFGVVALGGLLSIAIYLWNSVFRQGGTGWSLGKQALGIRLVKETSGEPMGAGMCFVRQIVHVVDQLPCYLGYLWPLWDAKKQTFADKIMTTVVVEQRKG